MARARYGQNFLIDPHWRKRIVDLFQPKDKFAEIGPGKGALTDLLVERFENFFVFEIDQALEEFHKGKSYRFIQMDFLDWDFCMENKPVENFSLIGNLPYESGTAIVLRVAEKSDQISHFVFMLQREVVERLCATPGGKKFGSLSVVVQGQFDLKMYPKIVPPGAFNPTPRVESRLVVGQRRTDVHSLDPGYLDFVHMAFQMKRKTFRNAVRSRFSSKEVAAVLDDLKLKSDCRAEQIPTDLWPSLYRRLRKLGAEN